MLSLKKKWGFIAEENFCSCTGLGNLQSAKTRSRKARVPEKLRETDYDRWLRSQNDQA